MPAPAPGSRAARRGVSEEETMAEVEPAPPVEFVETGAGRIAVRRTPPRGQGPHEPAVLIHGLGAYAGMWADLAEALSDRLACVSADLPGFGHSPPPADGDYSLASHLRAVAAVIEAVFPNQPVHVFGNSMGGLLAVQLAARRPELVRTLCLISPAMPERVPRPTNIHVPVMGLPVVGGAVFDRYIAGGAERVAQANFETAWADPARVPARRRAEAEEFTAWHIQQPYAKQAFIATTQSLITAFMEPGPQRPWALARQVRVPTLLVYGRRDKLVDSKAAHRSAKEFRDALVVIIPDSGHVAMMEHPEVIHATWRQFVDARHPAPTPPVAQRPDGDARTASPSRDGE